MTRDIQAATVSEAFWTLNPFELVSPSSEWYVPLSEHFSPREYGFVHQFVKRFEPARGAPEYTVASVIGPQGSGKSSQVRAALGRLRAHNIYPVYIKSQGEFDQADIEFSDVVWVVAHAVLRELEAAKCKIEHEFEKLIAHWFAEEILIDTDRSQGTAEVRTEAQASYGLAGLLKLVGKVTASLKADTEYRREVRRRGERNYEDLIDRLNQLLDAGARALSAKYGESGTKLAIVFDDLEKIPDAAQVDKAFVRRLLDIRRFHCHVVLFLDFAHELSPKGDQANQVGDLLYLPMLPMRGKEDRWDFVDLKARRAIEDILKKRLHLELLFDDPNDAIDRIARYSGGKLRDALQIARRACEFALQDKVHPDDLTIAIEAVRNLRASLVTPEMWRGLVAVHTTKNLRSAPEHPYLLRHSLILYYNQSGWWDVHPLLIEHALFQRELKAEKVLVP